MSREDRAGNDGMRARNFAVENNSQFFEKWGGGSKVIKKTIWERLREYTDDQRTESVGVRDQCKESVIGIGDKVRPHDGNL